MSTLFQKNLIRKFAQNIQQNNKSKIRNKIISININTKIIKKITLIIGNNFVDLTTPKNRKLKLKIEIFRIKNLKTCTYQFHKIILKNYQIISKNNKIKYAQIRTLYKP